MAGNKQAIKSRIRSVKSTKKITNAMQMIANAKLARLRKTMELNRTYARELQNLVDEILSTEQPLSSVYFTEHKSGRTLSIIFSSDLGLCGGYNSNIIKYARETLKPEDPMYVIGTNAYEHLKSAGFNVINKMISVDNLTEITLVGVMDEAIKMYLRDEISCIQMVYTKFINTVTFEPQTNVLLPYNHETKEKRKFKNPIADLQDITFDPSPEVVLDTLIEQMIRNVSFAISLETRTAEQASRRMAMETATDNAEELEDKLVLQYNQARQAAITQELTEIVATADAV